LHLTMEANTNKGIGVSFFDLNDAGGDLNEAGGRNRKLLECVGKRATEARASEHGSRGKHESAGGEKAGREEGWSRRQP
jgi:hypothetical protein